MKKPHISVALIGGRIIAHGYDEYREADWSKEGLVERGRLSLPEKAASELARAYRALFHRSFLVWPRVRAYLPVGAPAAEYLLWDGILRASGAWDWEMTGIENLLVPHGRDGYSAIIDSASDYVGVALLRGDRRMAGAFVQVSIGGLSGGDAGKAAAEAYSALLRSYARDANPDEAGLLAAAEIRIYCAGERTESEQGFRESLGDIDTGEVSVLGHEALEHSVRQAISTG